MLQNTGDTYLKLVSAPVAGAVAEFDWLWRLGGAEEKAAKGSLMAFPADQANELHQRLRDSA